MFILSFLSFATLSLNAQTNIVVFESVERQVALLELFTSEGCSSCPRAETWLSGLKRSPRLWLEFVPLAFHVDYWDYLGGGIHGRQKISLTINATTQHHGGAIPFIPPALC
jgi:hypothetical protein